MSGDDWHWYVVCGVCVCVCVALFVCRMLEESPQEKTSVIPLRSNVLQFSGKSQKAHGDDKTLPSSLNSKHSEVSLNQDTLSSVVNVVVCTIVKFALGKTVYSHQKERNTESIDLSQAKELL